MAQNPEKKRRKKILHRAVGKLSRCSPHLLTEEELTLMRDVMNHRVEGSKHYLTLTDGEAWIDVETGESSVKSTEFQA